ncbi:nucleoside-diphosphate-sugar epimerase [Bradyrhizobium sp. LB7.2]
MSAYFTIIGGAGFIGSRIGIFLAEQNTKCFVPDRMEVTALRGDLGHVVYCAGTTSDFRQRPFDTMEAHVCLLNKILRDHDFESLTYFSSTRVYIHSDHADEDAVLSVQPGNPGDLFNLSKLAGKSLCRQSGRSNVRSIRVSNVVGEDFLSRNFLFDLMHEAKSAGQIVLRSSLASEKDYIHISDVVAMTVSIARSGASPLYNLAAGSNLTNEQIVAEIRSEIPADLKVVPGAPTVKFQPIDISRAVGEFGFSPAPVLPYIRQLAAQYRDKAD